jgi:GT2 family glycosyltransferase
LPSIYIILINYNGYKDTIECVQSLRKINYENYKIIIVDNASTDDSIFHLKNSLKECILIESKYNFGFAGGNNLGIQYALKTNAEYILLLNNDTIVEPNFLGNMIEPLYNDKNIGIVGSKIMYYPQKNVIWYGGGKIDWFKFVGVHFGMKEIDKGQCDNSKEIDFMTGCCMLIKKEVFEKVGLLADEYFMYFEDVDYCVRSKQAGYKIWYNHKAVIYHKVGLSAGGEESPFSIKWGTRNRILFMKKYRNKTSILNFACSFLFFYTTRIIKCLQYFLKKDRGRIKSIINGIREGNKIEI